MEFLADLRNFQCFAQILDFFDFFLQHVIVLADKAHVSHVMVNGHLNLGGKRIYGLVINMHLKNLLRVGNFGGLRRYQS